MLPRIRPPSGGNRIGGVKEDSLEAALKRVKRYEDARQVDPVLHEAHLPPPLDHWDIPEPNCDMRDVSQIHLDMNAEATQAIRMINSGKSCAVVGGAGTGKSTIMARVVHDLIGSGLIPPCFSQSQEHYKNLGCDVNHNTISRGQPGILVVALSHKAKNAIAAKLSPHMDYVWNAPNGEREVTKISARICVMTIHAALAFQPVRTEIEEDDGTVTESMRFEPSRGSHNPLPDDIKLVILEEAGQVPLSLFISLYEALPNAQYVVLGDLGQIGAVGGMSVLGLFLASLPSVELLHVYRHGGAIMELATAVRMGWTGGLRPKVIDKKETPESTVVRATYPIPQMAASLAMDVCASFMWQLMEKELFVPMLDMALCPQDPEIHPDAPEKFGASGIWRRVAVKLDAKLGRCTHYISTASGPVVIAAGDVHYVDSASMGKQMWMVLGIEQNSRHKGAKYDPRPFSTRDPHTWKAMAEAAFEQSNGSLVSEVLFDAEANLDSLFSALGAEEGDAAAEDLLAAAKQGRQATHRIALLNVEMLESYLAGLGYEGQVRDRYAAHVINTLRNFACSVDYMRYTKGIVVPENEFTELLRNTLAVLKIPDYIQGSLVVTGSGADIGSMLPVILSVHKGQGSQGRNVVFFTHNSVGLNCAESGYTAVTRAREKLYTVTHGDYWGVDLSIPENLRSLSGVKRFTVKGATLAEKVASYRAQMEAESNSAGAKEERRYALELCEELKSSRPLGVM